MAESGRNKTIGVQTENTGRRNDAVGITLMLIQLFFIIVAIVLIVRLFVIWRSYDPDPVYIASFTPTVEKQVTKPVRGSILTHEGRLLATSVTHFNVHMDCTAQKKEYEASVREGDSLILRAEKYRALAAGGRNERRVRREANDMQKRGEAKVARGRKQESDWLAEAELLSHDLADALGDRTAGEWFDLIKTSRDKGKKFVEICKDVDYTTIVKLRQAHLFRGGRYFGGYIEEKTDLRQYPYGNLARRVIGAVSENNELNSNIGIEGKYDYALSGHEGTRWMRKTDRGKLIPDYDSVEVKVSDGGNVRTTLNMELQEIAHNALYDKILENDKIDAGCVIVMEVETGAIRAMVNLQRNKDGIPSEIYNFAVGQSGEPGSVFKLVTLMTLLEDKKLTTLETKVPTFGGNWKFNNHTTFYDEYLARRSAREISVIDGFKISSNNVFRYLAWDKYKDDPKRFTDKISEYKMTEAFDFDLLGCATPSLPSPGSPSWSATALPSIAMGYTVSVTPLHIVTLYNAVANKGKMLKPYLVESHEEDGKVYEHKPVILAGSICSTATADTLLRALCAVTGPEGTGSALRNAKFKVAGKTGTARVALQFNVNGKQVVDYKDNNGNHKHQATFVGFFPAEKPKYTAIVVMYSKLLPHGVNLYGAEGVPVFKSILDGVYALDETMQEPLTVQKRRRKAAKSGAVTDETIDGNETI